MRALEEVASVVFSDAPVTIFGAGGAARSVAVALAEKGVPRIGIVNRTKEKAEDIQALLASEFPAVEALAIGLDEHFEGLVASSKIVINATSLGMEGHLKTALVPVDKLSKDHIVCDLVYSKQETPLLVAAKEKRATLMGGLGMLLYQGAASIHLWTGMEPPVEVMRKALES
jgi:shikimate dehydrogenase